MKTVKVRPSLLPSLYLMLYPQRRPPATVNDYLARRDPYWMARFTRPRCDCCQYLSYADTGRAYAARLYDLL